ncbi:MAG TPA: sulfatase, partial [Pirellulales bacterium]|nr:sulfatase [Pirellulales bacterium]
MNPMQEFRQLQTRRHFLSRATNAVGWAALSSLMGGSTAQNSALAATAESRAMTHFTPKAKHVIYLHMVGGP